NRSPKKFYFFDLIDHTLLADAQAQTQDYLLLFENRLDLTAVMDYKQLQEERLRLTAIIERATDGIITTNEAGNIEMINPSAAGIFGYQPDELIGANIKILLALQNESDHDLYLHYFLHTDINEITGLIREVQGRKRDGSTFLFRLGMSAVQLSDRRVFTGIIQDLTEYNNITHALLLEKERLETYLDVANNIFVVLDMDGNTLKLNRRGHDILGYEPAEIIGKNWLDLVIPADAITAVKTRFQRQTRQLEPWREYLEDAILTKEGEVRMISWHNRLILNAEQQFVASISSGVDITEQKKAEENLRKLNSDLEKRVENRTEELAAVVKKLIRANKRLEQEISEHQATERALMRSEKELTKSLEKERELGDLKSRFVSMASHEFRTPLSTILSSAAILGKYTKAEDQNNRDRHIEKIKSSVASLTAILNDFLSIGKLEEGKIGYHPSAFNYNDFCIELIDDVYALLKCGQEIELVGLDEDQFLYLDRRLLKNSLINLLSNAIKYSGEGKKIRLVSQVNQNYLVIKIIDQGIGIPEEDKPHLFSRFFRAKNANNIQGTGLGLNIVKGYLNLMGANIDFESKEGLGTTFTIDIPLNERITNTLLK
ncbi:MAG: PAS domain-containing sensor histidine kinase, partial [Bacteroidota bacterium]